MTKGYLVFKALMVLSWVMYVYALYLRFEIEKMMIDCQKQHKKQQKELKNE